MERAETHEENIGNSKGVIREGLEWTEEKLGRVTGERGRKGRK
jgi:hypothetical protein